MDSVELTERYQKRIYDIIVAGGGVAGAVAALAAACVGKSALHDMV